MRNFYVKGKVDGRKTPIAGDPRNKDGDMYIIFYQKEKGKSVEILYIRTDYSGTNIEFLTFNSETKGVEIIPVSEYEALFDRLDILDKLDRTITFKEEELRILKAKKKAFLSYFPSLEG